MSIQTHPLKEQLLSIKKHIPVFVGLSEDNIIHMISRIQFLRYQSSEIVIRQNELGPNMFYVLTGSLDIYMFDQNTPYIESMQDVGSDTLDSSHITTIEKKAVFGEIASIMGEKRSATVVTAEESHLLAFNLDKKYLSQHLDIQNILYKNIIHIMTDNLVKTNHIIKEIS
jgi:CRP-like cAMP-binding protein